MEILAFRTELGESPVWDERSRALWFVDVHAPAVHHQLYLALRAQGHGKLGTQALMLALEQLSNTEVKI